MPLNFKAVFIVCIFDVIEVLFDSIAVVEGFYTRL